jgi:hypothetical protein
VCNKCETQTSVSASTLLTNLILSGDSPILLEKRHLIENIASELKRRAHLGQNPNILWPMDNDTLQGAEVLVFKDTDRRNFFNDVEKATASYADVDIGLKYEFSDSLVDDEHYWAVSYSVPTIPIYVQPE